MFRLTSRRTATAFTLIELLIVVAIIAILAAIAVPNFLDAQVRAKVSATKSNMRSLATAVESYYVDNNAFPTGWGIIVNPADANSHSLYLLSTPIAYFSTGNIQDVFVDQQSNTAMYSTIQWDPMTTDGRMISDYNINGGFPAVNGGSGNYINANEKPGWWVLISNGPDLKMGFGYYDPTDPTPDPSDPESNVQWRFHQAHVGPAEYENFLATIYNPTNGTISIGNIYRAGGSAPNEAGRAVISSH